MYRLNVAGYNGDAGDAIAAPVHPLRICNGMQFTTRDQDNDNHVAICRIGSGWWYNLCDRSSLNIYANAIWNADTDVNIMDVKFARMLVKLD